jgi:hypothetical protein
MYLDIGHGTGADEGKHIANTAKVTAQVPRVENQARTSVLDVVQLACHPERALFAK